MAVNPLSPGVYIDEISVFPPSVAPVATAVPAFIGYTEKGPVMEPTRITSMLEYETVFGGAYAEQFDIGLTGTSTALSATTIGVTVTLSEFNMHYNLRMYFANGGGPCYIVSVSSSFYGATISHTDLIDGVNATERADEVTLLVVPEAISSSINSSQRSAIHSAQLDLCAKMKDRFSLMDVPATVPAAVGSIATDAATFRNSEVGMKNLKYGAAYYPSLETLLTRFYNDDDIDIDDDRTGPNAGPFYNHKLTDILNGISAVRRVEILAGIADGDTINIAGVTFEAKDPFPGSPTPEQFDASGTTVASAASLAATINAHPAASLLVKAAVNPSNTSEVIVTAVVAGTSGNGLAFSTSDPTGYQVNTVTPASNFLVGGVNADKLLYNAITDKLAGYTLRLYPSSGMAGVYASVDRDRGVWKAPANVSLAGVVAPSVNISANDQDGLNVDPSAGKSINAIRAFAGKGVLAWGARTLAGNDSEWRYINVRRLFIFAEESIQKASEFVVFEPNDRNTWSRVNTLITNFLTNLWRDGALAGATAKDAFFVKVGLGETMTAQDILDGKLIIQVGLAAVRPAEFIILQFSHKLQES